MTSELGRRLGFTIGALLVYRLGTFIPLPGVDAAAWGRIVRSDPGELLGLAGSLSGGGAHRMAVLALGLTPFLSAAIALQFISFVFRALRALPGKGDRGRAKLAGYTINLTIALAVFQAFGIAYALEDVPSVVIEPGWPFRLTIVATLAGGSLLLVWLCGQITARGLGNGVTLILFAGVVADLPAAAAGTIELGRRGVLSTNLMLGIFAFAGALTALVILMELAQRRMAVTYYWSRPVGTPVIEGQGHLVLKLNNAGVIPALVTSWAVGPGHPIVYGLVLVFGVYLYSAWVVDPEQVAGDLARQRGVIAGIEPGEATADHIDHVLSRTTLIGAAYLAAVMLIPDLLVSYAHVPVYLGGTSLLIVVCAILDLEAQLRARAFMQA